MYIHKSPYIVGFYRGNQHDQPTKKFKLIVLHVIVTLSKVNIIIKYLSFDSLLLKPTCVKNNI